MNPTPLMYSEFTIPLLLAMIFAATMGGSGTAPSFGAAYGAGLVGLRKIPWLFGILVFVGALVAGKKVVVTISGGILPADTMTITITTIVLLSVTVSMLLANFLRVPQSTSQSTVLALAGVALYLGRLQTDKLLFEIIPTWFVLPLAGFVLMWLLMFVFKSFKEFDDSKFEELNAHPVLRYIVIVASCYVAFSIGANNVANASGTVVSLMLNELNIPADSHNYTLVLLVATLVVAPCFGIGSAMFGQPLLESTGKELIKITPLAASVISFITASLLLAASLTKGIPTSLVQLNTAVILALGVHKVGWSILWKDATMQRFWVIWIVAPAIAFGVAYGFTWGAELIGLV